MHKAVVACLALASAISACLAETCQKPEVAASAYVTEDATVLTNVAFTTQFVLKCSNGVKGISLYAEIEGKVLPAVRLSADNKYQVREVCRTYERSNKRERKVNENNWKTYLMRWRGEANCANRAITV